jgi:drug/metabolite transporter (DMT)-like permease
MITIISVVLAIFIEEIPRVCSPGIIVEFIYLILFATIGAQALMNHCIRFVSSSAAGIIFSSESIFAAVLGILILGEPSNLYLWAGIILIVGSIALYNTGLPRRGKDIKS